jgi:hypothetical protein
MVLGILLIPVCVAVTQTVISLIAAIRPSPTGPIPLPALALGGGMALWMAVYWTLPRPVRTYVLAHELTHALWGWMMGARVLGLSVGASRGSVTLSKTNPLITLAPYFFPLYTVLIIAAHAVLSLFFGMERYELLWLALVGWTWGFHVTFTAATLMQHQSDVQECGYLFSYAVIYAMNVLGVGLWIVAVSSATLEQMIDSFAFHAATVGHVMRAAAGWLTSQAGQ